MDSDVESVFDDYQDESDAYSPEPKPKAKATAKKAVAAKSTAKAAPKKSVQTTLKTKAAPKKRAKPSIDDDEDSSFDGNMSNTPPNAKKQKKDSAPKVGGGKPLGEIENDSAMQLDGPTESRPSNPKTATEQYTKLSPVEHILIRPDTYIGSIERTESQMWVYNKERSLMEHKTIKLVPGFYKIFDEILVNAADNKQRDKSMSYIKININREEGEISVENDGKGIPIEMHEKEGVYIPELVFGHLLAGSNFDDNEKKTVGGRNGYGAKLCNVFSKEFTLECQDSANGKRFKATWRDNMGKMDKHKITTNKSKDFVRVTFKPDFAKFDMTDGIDDDTESIMYRRVYDLAGTVEGVKVYLNGEHLKVGFKKYCEMYAKAIAKDRQDLDADGSGPPPATVIFEDTKAHTRWQIGFTVSDGSFQQVSFVNSIATTSGGTHVNYIADQICGALLKDLTKKMKGHSLKANHVRNHIFIFVNCLINNPAFNSQTKEYMTTKPSAFGSKCVLTDGFINKIRKTEAIENILHYAEKKADKMMAKTDGNKRSRISNEKLVDANLAGTKHGHECTLILTEGDSARGLAVAGRAILDPDRIGVFPLRGKMLNVRDASIDQILKNQEISNIKQFMGLKHKETYTDTKRLRYGHLMIMADQDHDGSHIKGLLINFLQVQFPSLLQIPDFFREFTTPVVKVWQGPNPKKPLRMRSFFTMPEYEEWKERHHHEIKKWHYKYFKGLGTSTNEDAQVYFTDLDNHLKEFHTMKPEETELFELAFSKKKADARKEWLGRFVPGTFLDHSTKSITYSDFVNKELILFSMADNLRSIPSVVDGLKPGQRKVVFACFKRNLDKDKKVVELAGYVSEQTAYHHGEASLQQTIIGLAQNFVGSNNINVLEPSGNFGSRLAGGSDAASARYIFTRLSPFARRVFSPLDEPVLEAQFEDGKQIEPKIYAPVIPMVLCNGADGIGTGWSTTIPNYHPMDIVNNLKRRMGRLNGSSAEGPFETMIPWFRGWKGQVEPEGGGKYKFNGIVSQEKPNEILVTELPVRVWTDDFKARLEQIIRGDKGISWIKDYKEFNDHRNVHFEIQMDDKVIKKALDDNELLEKFKLTKSIGTTNLVAFDPRGQIRKYDNVEQILEEFYLYRFNVYTERRAHWLQVLDSDYERLKNMARFVEEIISGKLVVARKKKTVLIEELRKAKYRPFPKGDTVKRARNTDEEMDQEEDGDKEDDVEDSSPGAGDYDYLLSMQIYSLTLERLERLKKQIAKKKAEKDELEALDEKDLWCRDLDAFVEEWENQMRLDDEIRTNIRKMGRRHSKKIGAGKGVKRARKDDDDYDPGSKSSKSRPGLAKPGRMVKTVISPVKTTAQQRFASHFAKPTKPAPTGNDGTAESDEEFTVESFKREAPTTTRPVRAKKPSILQELSDDSDEDFEALLEPETKTQPAAMPTETTTDAEDEDIVPTSEAKTTKAAPAKKSPPVASQSEDEDEDFTALSRPKTRPRAANTKKPSPVMDRSDDDEDFALPEQPKSQAKAAPAKKPSPVIDITSDDDEDFGALPKPKSKAKAVAAKKSPSADSELDQEPEPEIEEPKLTTGRGKRAAASKAKKWVFDETDDESEGNGDNVIDVGSLVRGIGEPAADATNGRLSLFAMSRSDHGNATIPKLKTKQARANFDADSFDDTNYEMLAKSSPHRATKSSDVEMSENEHEAVVSKGAKGKQALNVGSASTAKKRGRPAGSKNLKAKEETTINKLSPIAKTKPSTATGRAKKDIFDFTDGEDEDGDVRMGGSAPAVRSRAASGRPGRAAASKKSYALPSDDDSMADADAAESALSGSE